MKQHKEHRLEVQTLNTHVVNVCANSLRQSSLTCVDHQRKDKISLKHHKNRFVRYPQRMTPISYVIGRSNHTVVLTDLLYEIHLESTSALKLACDETLSLAGTATIRPSGVRSSTVF